MSARLVYVPSGRSNYVRDDCRDCGTGQFPGEVVMVYDRATGETYLICEACYRRRQPPAPGRFLPDHRSNPLAQDPGRCVRPDATPRC
jgi:hypothetical protein